MKNTSRIAIKPQMLSEKGGTSQIIPRGHVFSVPASGHYLDQHECRFHRILGVGLERAGSVEYNVIERRWFTVTVTLVTCHHLVGGRSKAAKGNTHLSPVNPPSLCSKSLPKLDAVLFFHSALGGKKSLEKRVEYPLRSLRLLLPFGKLPQPRTLSIPRRMKCQVIRSHIMRTMTISQIHYIHFVRHADSSADKTLLDLSVAFPFVRQYIEL